MNIGQTIYSSSSIYLSETLDWSQFNEYLKWSFRLLIYMCATKKATKYMLYIFKTSYQYN